MATNSVSLRLGDQFYSYDELLARLNAFQQSTFTQLTRLSTEKLPESDELSALFKYRIMRYRCKQGHRCKAPSSTLQRPLQRSFKVGCPVMLNVRLNRPKGKDPFLKVTKLVLDHEGHEVSKAIFKHYPEQRRIETVETDDTDTTPLSAFTMKTSESEQSQIIEQRYGTAVMTQDKNNMQRQLGVGKGDWGKDEAIICEGILRDVIANGGHGELGRDETGHFVFVTFQICQMRDLLARYPECLIMNCTKVNNCLYPLLSIMVINGEGHGMPVFHAFLAKENRFIMEKCLTIFAQQFNRDRIQCLIVDKDMAEIAAIEGVFPGVSVNLSHFHISQAVEGYLKRKLGGGGKSTLVKVVLDSFMSQVNTNLVSEFEEFKRVISQLVPQSVINYFEDNWWSKRHLWAACENINVIEFETTTTNTLKSYHSKMNKLINKKLSLSNVLSKITERPRLQIIVENSTVYNLSERDRNVVTSKMTTYGAYLVKQELSLAEKIAFDVSECLTKKGTYNVAFKYRRFVVSHNTCTCSTFCHKQIPCRHIFFVRRHLGMVLLEDDLIPERFRRTADCPSVPTEHSISTVPLTPFSRHTVDSHMRTVDSRFKRAKVVCNKAVNFLSSLGAHDFQLKMQELEEFISRWSSACEEVQAGVDLAVPAVSGEVLCSVNLQEDVKVDLATPVDVDPICSASSVTVSVCPISPVVTVNRLAFPGVGAANSASSPASGGGIAPGSIVNVVGADFVTSSVPIPSGRPGRKKQFTERGKKSQKRLKLTDTIC